MFLSKQKRAERVAIAQDALAQLEADKYVVLAGNGYVWSWLDETVPQEDDLQDHLEALQDCEVCLLGACFLSFVRRHDSVRISELDRSPSGRSFLTHSGVVFDRLSQFFDKATLARLEAAFEGRLFRSAFNWAWIRRPGVEAAIAFGRQWDDPKVRAINILKCVIAHNGEFNPASDPQWRDAGQLERLICELAEVQ